MMSSEKEEENRRGKKGRNAELVLKAAEELQWRGVLKRIRVNFKRPAHGHPGDHNFKNRQRRDGVGGEGRHHNDCTAVCSD